MNSRRNSRIGLLLASASLVGIVIFTILTLWLSPPTVLETAQDTPLTPATNMKIVDGDSVSMLDEQIRLMCVDAPEKNQPGGRAATKFFSQLVAGGVNILRRGKDKYGRTLAIFVISRHGITTTASEELVREGHAWLYRRYAEDCGISRKKLTTLENEARSAKRGLWHDKNPIAPWDWRRG